MSLIPLRANNAYMGFAKQSGQGILAAPSIFPRWQDGSSIDIDLKTEDVKEGDTSRHLSLIIKNGQSAKIKITFAPRPNEVGFFEAAAQGASSDAVTGATVNTMLSALVAAGATSISVAANTGLTGSGTIALVLEPGTATEETALFTIPATGAGPYVLAVAATYNGGHLKLGHANAGVVRSSTSHVITDQTDGNYYSIEVSLGGTAGQIIRARDCKLDSLKRSAKSGSLLMYEAEFIGCVSSVQVSAATVTLEAHDPFLFTQGVWTLDGATTGDAPYLEQFAITQKNNLDPVQTEQLTPDAIIFGAEELDVTFDYPMQNNSRMNLVYFGATSGTTDSQTLGTGALLVIFSHPNGFNTVQYSIGFLAYIKASPPAPKADGKHFVQSVEAKVTSNQGALATLMTTTVTASQTTAYG